jgi:hypothetical protein
MAVLGSSLTSARDALADMYLPSRTFAAAAEGAMRFTSFSAAVSATTPVPEANVVGVGIGVNSADPKDDSPTLQIFVRQKFPKDDVSEANMLPSEFQGKPVTVTQSDALVRFADPTIAVRPLVPGISVGPVGVYMAGTLGAVLTDGEKAYLISNNHVFADENRLGPGTQIFQPGALDGGDATRLVAALTVAPALLAGGVSNEVDCAIAELQGVPASNALPGEPNIGAVAEPALGMQVFKYGRSSGRTVGRVTTIGFIASVVYNMGPVRLVEQIVITTSDGTPFSQPGDSGSLIREMGTGDAVGLLVGGSSQATVASDVSRVLAALQAAKGGAALAFA